MTLAEFVALARKRWVMILVPMVLLTVASYAMAASQTPMYRSTSSSYFSLAIGDSANDIFQGSNYTQQQLGSFARLATEPVVLNEVIDELGLDESAKSLGRRVSATASPETVIVDIAVTDSDPDRAAAIANSVTKNWTAAVRDLSPELPNGQPSVTATDISPATPASYAFSPNTRQSVAIGLMGGLLLGLVIAVARESLDTRVRGADDLPEGVRIIAEVEDERRLESKHRWSRGVSKERASAIRTESYRKLRTNLRFLNVDNPVRVLVITSSVAGEGKSTTAIELSRVLAGSGERVLLIDGDLRQPKIASYLGLEGSVGLADILAGTADVSAVTQQWGAAGLSVLASGSIPPNPSELLGSRAFADLVAKLRGEFDHVIIDSPPLLPVTDASVASIVADGVVVVIRHGRTTQRQVKTAAESLAAVEARILGAVINAMPTKRSAIRTAGYGYYNAPAADLHPFDGPNPAGEPSAPIVADESTNDPSGESPRDATPAPEAARATSDQVTSKQAKRPQTKPDQAKRQAKTSAAARTARSTSSQAKTAPAAIDDAASADAPATKPATTPRKRVPRASARNGGPPSPR